QVAELAPLGGEVRAVVRTRLHLDGLAARDLQAVALEPHDLPRVVRQELDRAEAQVEQDLGADTVVAQVRLEAERLVRLYRVLSLILERVRADLVGQPDAPALLPQVDDGAEPLL